MTKYNALCGMGNNCFELGVGDPQMAYMVYAVHLLSN